MFSFLYWSVILSIFMSLLFFILINLPTSYLQFPSSALLSMWLVLSPLYLFASVSPLFRIFLFSFSSRRCFIGSCRFPTLVICIIWITRWFYFQFPVCILLFLWLLISFSSYHSGAYSMIWLFGVSLLSQSKRKT